MVAYGYYYFLKYLRFCLHTVDNFILTYSRVNLSTHANTVPFLPDAEVTKTGKYKGAHVHCYVRQRGHQTSLFDVKFEHVGEILGKVSDHCKVPPVMANLRKEIDYSKFIL